MFSSAQILIIYKTFLIIEVGGLSIYKAPLKITEAACRCRSPQRPCRKINIPNTEYASSEAQVQGVPEY